ncbi:MAG: hypothetical protein H7Z72_24725 [Bacteroidetes bacterium]|nr:hypothetical protein [Fibrella sp.]
MRDVGFNTVKPRINQISFKKAGYVTLNLADGRIVNVPLNRFPGLDRLTPVERRQYHIADGEIVLFHHDDEVYHIQDFLGTYETNAYKAPVQPPSRRLTNTTGDTIKVSGLVVRTKKNKQNVDVDGTIH